MDRAHHMATLHSRSDDHRLCPVSHGPAWGSHPQAGGGREGTTHGDLRASAEEEETTNSPASPLTPHLPPPRSSPGPAQALEETDLSTGDRGHESATRAAGGRGGGGGGGGCACLCHPASYPCSLSCHTHAHTPSGPCGSGDPDRIRDPVLILFLSLRGRLNVGHLMCSAT